MSEKKPLSVRELDLIDYIMDHPDLSPYACALARGFKGGYASKILKRIQPDLEARKAREAAAVEKASIARKVVTRSVIEDRALVLASLDPLDTNKNIAGQVNALRLLAEMGGHIVHKSADVSKEFENKSEQELEFFSIHGYWPTKVGSGESRSTESESSSQIPTQSAKKPN